MDLNKLTQKTQEALHDAQTKALRFGHTEIDTQHLLLALLDQPEGLVERLLVRAEVDVAALRQAIEDQLGAARACRATGPRRRGSPAACRRSSTTRSSRPTG